MKVTIRLYQHKQVKSPPPRKIVVRCIRYQINQERFRRHMVLQWVDDMIMLIMNAAAAANGIVEGRLLHQCRCRAYG